MKTTLHITNGDSAAQLIQSSTVTGDVLPWRDPMHHGPFPDGLNFADTSDRRAEYLAGDTLDLAMVRQGFYDRDTTLGKASDYAEVVLWFEHDLLDQLQILQIIDWLNTRKPATQLSIICIDHFDGCDRFRGLGQLNPVQIASLLDTRTPVSEAMLRQASTVWAMFRAPDPLPLVEYAQEKDDLFPFMCKALRRHFEEYPWLSDHLTRTERQLLTLLQNGEQTPAKLFTDNMDLESALYIGDWTTFSIIDSLVCTEQPLIQSVNNKYVKWQNQTDEEARKAFTRQPLRLTNSGAAVLNNHAKAETRRDCWLGGVHLNSAKSLWLWDHQESQLQHIIKS